MEPDIHTCRDLFEQLGLPGDRVSIGRFLREQAPLPQDMHLEDAPCWNAAQARFLRESRLQDANWALRVDELDALMRRAPV